MLKSIIVALLVASASAFAPASTVVRICVCATSYNIDVEWTSEVLVQTHTQHGAFMIYRPNRVYFVSQSLSLCTYIFLSLPVTTIHKAICRRNVKGDSIFGPTGKVRRFHGG